MKSFFTTKRLCRAGIIAALYTALTYAFAPLAFGPFQVRPAEALCILALIYPEAIPALCVGCALSNLASPYAFYDVTFGSMITLSAALFSYLVGSKLKNVPLKIFLGGFFPVLLNAALIPLVIIFFGDGAGDSALLAFFLSSARSCLPKAFGYTAWEHLCTFPFPNYVKRVCVFFAINFL